MASLALGLLAWLPQSCGEGFDWERDCIVLQSGKQLRGVVIQSFPAFQGLEGEKVEMFEDAWKAWTASFAH